MKGMVFPEAIMEKEISRQSMKILLSLTFVQYTLYRGGSYLRGTWEYSCFVFMYYWSSCQLKHVSFVGLHSSDLSWFLFLFGSITKASSIREDRARTLMHHLRGYAFQLCYYQFSKSGEMDEEARSYMVVKAASCVEFGAKRNLQNSVKYPSSLRLHGVQSAYEFSLKAENTYEQLESTVENGRPSSKRGSS